MEKNLMKKWYDGKMTPRARDMRKDMTHAEKILWRYLRDRPERFYRQRVIGPFIADFYCSRLKLIIEADGSQHYTPDGLSYDLERDSFFAERGIRVLRFPNREITDNFPAVRARIDAEILNRSEPHPLSPSPFTLS